jgi:hypothetical protein
MRTLEKNKTKLWFVTRLSNVEMTDENGFLTGEKTITYTEPVQITISLVPKSGNINNYIFGKDVGFDMMAISTDVDLDRFTYLYYNQPVGDYDKTFDFEIAEKKISLNVINYALRSRVQ